MINRRGKGVESLFENPVAFFFLALMAAGVATGCVPSPVTVSSRPDLGNYSVRTLVVLPFTTLSTPQISKTTTAPVEVPAGVVRSGISITLPQSAEPLHQPARAVPAFAGDKITRLFVGKLRGQTGVSVLSPDPEELGPFIPGVQWSGTEPLFLDTVRKIVAGFSADAALVGQVLVYREREGSRLGADPAAVGFEVKLVARDGQVLWVGNYYEQQRPLNEDFRGFLERGFGFVTAEELASSGAEKIFRQFPFSLLTKGQSG